jgi:hypothetical protein
LHKILALAQNVGRISKYREMFKIKAANISGKYVRNCKITATYDRNKADVEISAPIKIYVPKLCVHKKIGAQCLLFGLGCVSNC